MLFIFISLLRSGTAFSTGAGGCSNNGNGSVPDFNSHGRGRVRGSGGDLSLGGLTVSLSTSKDEPGFVLNAQSTVTLQAGVEYYLSLSGNGFRGFLKRLESIRGRDTREALAPIDDKGQIANQCTVVQQVGGVTHMPRATSQEPLTSVTTSLLLEDNDSEMMLDITAVVYNRVVNGNQVSEFYWSRFFVTIRGAVTDEPTSSPTGSPSETPSTIPSVQPSDIPSSFPSIMPSAQPTALPSAPPSLSKSPSIEPTDIPSQTPTFKPTTRSPVISDAPSDVPSDAPSDIPSSVPSVDQASSTSIPTSQTADGIMEEAPLNRGSSSSQWTVWLSWTLLLWTIVL